MNAGSLGQPSEKFFILVHSHIWTLKTLVSSACLHLSISSSMEEYMLQKTLLQKFAFLNLALTNVITFSIVLVQMSYRKSLTTDHN